MLQNHSRNGTRRREQCKRHELTKYHQTSLSYAADLIQKIEKPEVTLPNQIDQRRAANIERNCNNLKSIFRAVLFCGRQGIALRGGIESGDGPGNPGNLLALLKLLSVNDSLLQEHMELPVMKNAKYFPPHTQNEIVEVL